MSGDNGLRLALTLADERLQHVEEYLERFADADCPGLDGYQPNEAMKRLQDVQHVRALFARIGEEADARWKREQYDTSEEVK